MDNPTISVIVPVYNVEPYLRRCVDSILAQTFSDLEILLVDDGSTDGSPAICDEYTGKDSRVKAFHKPNGGLSSARNLGLDAAAGQYIAFVDSDDYIDRTMYEQLLLALRQAGADISIGGFQKVDGQDAFIGEPGSVAPSKLTGMQALEKLYTPDYVYYTIACNKLFKKELFSVYRFPEGKLFEDGYAAFRYYYASSTVVCLPGTYYYYFIRSGSLTQSVIGLKNLDGIDADRDSLLFLLENNVLPLVEKAQTKYAASIINNLRRFDWKQKAVRLRFKQIHMDFLSLYPAIQKNRSLTKKEKMLIASFKISPRLCHWLIKVKKL